jgi:RNA polymerase sigma-70 factor (ECF subfamily)
LDGDFNADYLRRLSLGDPETERNFCSYFGDLLQIRLGSQFKDTNWVDDVRQETLFRVLRTVRANPSKIHRPESLGSYVLSVSRNIVLERFKSEGKYTSSEEEALERADPSMDQEGDMITAERQVLVRRLLEEMPGRDRLLLTEVFMEERDKDEICRTYAVDRGYLRVLVFRARQRFRDLMEKRIFEKVAED